MPHQDARTAQYCLAMFKVNTSSACSWTHHHCQRFVVELFTIDHGFEWCVHMLTLAAFESGALEGIGVGLCNETSRISGLERYTPPGLRRVLTRSVGCRQMANDFLP